MEEQQDMAGLLRGDSSRHRGAGEVGGGRRDTSGVGGVGVETESTLWDGRVIPPFCCGRRLHRLGPAGGHAWGLDCVLHGARSPVVLRRQDQHFVHIGLCLVLCFSDGEAAEKISSGEIKVREFAIC